MLAGISPIPTVQAGSAAGGGMLDSLTGGATQAPAAADGSVGLFDGVVKKALMGGAVGAAAGFLPFIPGGPLIGGVVGALGGAALGVFGNWRKMEAIKQENAALLGAMGVQTSDPAVAQALVAGNEAALAPAVQETAMLSAQAANQQAAQQQATQQAAPKQSAQQALPSMAPAGGVIIQGGGGSAGQVGMPPAPVDTTTAPSGTTVTEIAPAQAGIGEATTTTPPATTTAQTASQQQVLQVVLEQLRAQIEQLEQIVLEMQRA